MVEKKVCQKVLFLPALEKFLQEAKPWGITKSYYKGTWHENDDYSEQRTDPNPKNLLKVLGIKEKETVLFVAGHRGTWSLALAKAGAFVTYSELSQELTDLVRKEVKHQNIKEYICENYLLIPSKGVFDWTCTFEAVGPKEFILLRSLLNKKGGKYVIWNHAVHAKTKLETLEKTIWFIERVYGAKGTIVTKKVLARSREQKEKEREHFIITIRTNKEARKKASEDFLLFEQLHKKRTISAKKETLQRLKEWKKLFPERFFKQVKIKEFIYKK